MTGTGRPVPGRVGTIRIVYPDDAVRPLIADYHRMRDRMADPALHSDRAAVHRAGERLTALQPIVDAHT